MFYSILWLRDELLQETSKDPELQTLTLFPPEGL